MSRCVGRRLVCVVGVLLFLIELGINKFCGLSDVRFLGDMGWRCVANSVVVD